MTTATSSPFAMTATGTSAPPSPPIKRIAEGTAQQEDIWEAIRAREVNIVVNALAGTGKSTTCRESMFRVKDADPSARIRYTCFNKAIATEFGAKCPPGVEVGTMHSFALRALSNSFAPTIDKNKTYAILDEIPGGTKLARPLRRNIGKLVSLAKNHAITDPKDFTAWDDLDNLIDYYEISFFANERDKAISVAIEAIERSAQQTSIVDFDDMLWLPLIHDVRFPSCDILFIDEAQDMNAVQHRLAALLNPDGVTVVIGDPHQAIYGFRGSDSESMAKMTDQLNALVLPLTMTFRCPQSHVRLARQIVPDFEAHPSNPEGTLAAGSVGDLQRARPGDLVLCRANAPLVKECLALIARGVRANMRGRAIGDRLEAVFLKADRNQSRTVADFTARLEAYRRREATRLDAKEGSKDLIEQLTDRCAAVEAIASSCQSPADVIPAIRTLFSDDDPAGYVTFSSIHRAKGSEARRVWLIDKPYAPPGRGRHPQPWELVQRANLTYVGQTRSLDTLTVIPYAG